MEEEKSNQPFGRASSQVRESTSQPSWKLTKRVSDQVRQPSKLSQAVSRGPSYVTEDDIGDEGITELFNYLSDPESEDSKRYSNPYQPKFESHSKTDEQRSKSNETGTFPFGRESEEVMFANVSKEKSLKKSPEGEQISSPGMFNKTPCFLNCGIP